MTRLTAFVSALLVCAGSALAQQRITVVNAANGSTVVAPDSLVSIFGTDLASQTAVATPPFPDTLGGVRVNIGDSSGTGRSGGMIYVSGGQINFLMPAATTSGLAGITVGQGATGTPAPQGNVTVQPVAPGIFSATGDGKGVAAAIGIRVVDVVGPQVSFPVFSCTAASGNSPAQCRALPIDTGLDSPVFLALFGTGLKGAKNVTVTIGSVSVPVLYAGPQGYPGLDQVNVGVPLTLRGAGLVNVVVTADGVASNPVQVAIQ